MIIIVLEKLVGKNRTKKFQRCECRHVLEPYFLQSRAVSTVDNSIIYVYHDSIFLFHLLFSAAFQLD